MRMIRANHAHEFSCQPAKSVGIFGYIAKMLYLCIVKEIIAGTMKWNELRRIAEDHGWTLLRNGRNHDVYAHPEKPYRIEIGRHGKEEVKNGTFHKLKKQIGF